MQDALLVFVVVGIGERCSRFRRRRMKTLVGFLLEASATLKFSQVTVRYHRAGAREGHSPSLRALAIIA